MVKPIILLIICFCLYAFLTYGYVRLLLIYYLRKGFKMVIRYLLLENIHFHPKNSYIFFFTFSWNENWLNWTLWWWWWAGQNVFFRIRKNIMKKVEKMDFVRIRIRIVLWPWRERWYKNDKFIRYGTNDRRKRKYYVNV